mgnify:CR=1 FL=1
MHSSTRRIYIILIVLLFMISIFSLSTGSVQIPKTGIIKYFLGMGGDLSDSMKTILISVRLPRILMAVLIGMLLSSSGTVVQTVFQNPLAAVEIKQGLINYCTENNLSNINEIVAYAHTDDGKAYRKRIFSK